MEALLILSDINRWNSLCLLAIVWANNRAYIDIRGPQKLFGQQVFTGERATINATQGISMGTAIGILIGSSSRELVGVKLFAGVSKAYL